MDFPKIFENLYSISSLFFESNPPNLVRIHFCLCCINAEIFVTISQMVSDLAKSVWSAPSISWDIFDYGQTFFSSLKTLPIMSIEPLESTQTGTNAKG